MVFFATLIIGLLEVAQKVQSINVATACLKESVEHLVQKFTEYVSAITKSTLAVPYFDQSRIS